MACFHGQTATAMFTRVLTCSITHSGLCGYMQIIRSLVAKDQYEPPVQEYIAAAHQRVKEKQAKQKMPFSLL